MIGQVRQLEGDAASPELLEMVRLLGGHARNTASSDKQTELWQVGGNERKWSVYCFNFACCREEPRHGGRLPSVWRTARC